MKRLDPSFHLVARICALSPEERAEVECFVEFLAHRRKNHSLPKVAALLTGKALESVWNNDEDAAYDKL